jgi:hypothetical protein
MRPVSIAGLVFIILGAISLIAGGTFTTKKNVLTIGDAVKVTADEEHTIPVWAGVAAVIAGVVLVGAGGVGRRPR